MLRRPVGLRMKNRPMSTARDRAEARAKTRTCRSRPRAVSCGSCSVQTSMRCFGERARRPPRPGSRPTCIVFESPPFLSVQALIASWLRSLSAATGHAAVEIRRPVLSGESAATVIMLNGLCTGPRSYCSRSRRSAGPRKCAISVRQTGCPSRARRRRRRRAGVAAGRSRSGSPRRRSRPSGTARAVIA